ncbi:MAG TPA: metallophosphoesterase family protein [Fervidobacterium sp.]|nr:serine/threonine protein phosphatase [Fervidobacterium sp.]HOK87721.1 metallophosphoesterase family protein [Fervidobacterium sp.]HOM74060.1 metallophosphoesterase family protein [Fervidobacterium sp.]HPP17682.1 metallophosphoesterase family protein [Fervidobacterium sp.]HRD19853.1 metallophosphoesterase family protein [Fervidobacterium sp.]
MIWAIGDIHGCLKALEKLIDQISPTNDDKLIFLGDYVDRGPDSKEVVDFLCSLSKTVDCTFLRGNHEQMLLDVLDSNEDTYRWIINGASYTWRSYGNMHSMLTYEEHMEFFRSTKYYHVEENVEKANGDTGRYLFVHAGVRPNVPVEKQDPQDLVWIREEFILRQHNLGYIVIFGHTPLEDILVEKDKIGIDTGCVYGGKLTAYCITNDKIRQVECTHV